MRVFVVFLVVVVVAFWEGLLPLLLLFSVYPCKFWMKTIQSKQQTCFNRFQPFEVCITVNITGKIYQAKVRRNRFSFKLAFSKYFFPNSWKRANLRV